MILCLPFLMFQGRAQEAIDHYLDTFPDAKLLEVLHHPEGTEIFDPAAENDDATTPGARSTREETAAGGGSSEAIEGSADRRLDDTAAMEAVVDWEKTLVATAQLRVGGQVLMIQDSLVKQDFDFTPSMSIAVVVDTAEEFSRITESLAEAGEYLMEPGDYEFAQNFAWVKDRFGVTWQINHPHVAPDPENPDSAANAAPAKAPEWS
ncbi:VOC family protein [Nesterenkonia muleiensis]|uniref:VOC family protein n=1 Tax=Nesterenkonia muleiensis TaxID=2282648 RepID=UPI000E76DB39|nr:VOC family protein [Nesterenkonia muleiensis]